MKCFPTGFILFKSGTSFTSIPKMIEPREDFVRSFSAFEVPGSSSKDNINKGERDRERESEREREHVSVCMFVFGRERDERVAEKIKEREREEGGNRELTRV